LTGVQGHRLQQEYALDGDERGGRADGISTAGTFRLHAQQLFLSQVLKGEDIGCEEVGDGIWNIVYYRTLLGKIDDRTLLITGV
jgi:hypothetical protein